MTATTKQKPAWKKKPQWHRRGRVEEHQQEGQRLLQRHALTPRYKNEDGEWTDSNSFGQDDLLRLMKLLDEADSFIQNELQDERKSKAV